MLRNAETTSASLNKAEDKARARGGAASKPCAPLTRRCAQLRREIPETVAACQAALDERLPQTLKAVAVGDLVQRAAAALAAHDAQLAAKQEETRRVISRLYEQQERKVAQAAAAQQARSRRGRCSASAARRSRCLRLLRRSGTRRSGKRRLRRWRWRHNNRRTSDIYIC